MQDRILKRLEYNAGMNSRKTECGAKQYLAGLVVRAAPFALLWNLRGKPETVWEGQIDLLMRLQMTTLQYPERGRLYDRMQQLACENLAIICLASPHVLVAATNRLVNFQPAIMRSYALWNAEVLYFRE
jgi:ABC-type transport system substrate-binding protein